jgi:hypothetical protein
MENIERHETIIQDTIITETKRTVRSRPFNEIMGANATASPSHSLRSGKGGQDTPSVYSSCGSVRVSVHNQCGAHMPHVTG